MSQYFDTVDTATLCRGGGNGSWHPSQIKGLEFVEKGESLLDVGCGSGTTYEAIQKYCPEKGIKYEGIDAVKKHIDWCRKQWPAVTWEQQDGMHLSEKDKSWDVVWSRHVVDHLASLKRALTEHMRVARKKVICILWYSFSGSGFDEINQVHYDQDYVEYLNSYGEQETLDFLNQQTGWKYTIIRGIALPENKAVETDGDILICLERK